MKAAVITSSYPWQEGSTPGVFVRTVNQQLRTKGHHIEVICPRVQRRSKAFVASENIIEIPCARDPRKNPFDGSGFLRANWTQQYTAAARFVLGSARKIREADYGALIFHWPYPSAILLGASTKEIPQVWVWHSASAHLARKHRSLRFLRSFLASRTQSIAHWFSSEQVHNRVSTGLPADARFRVAPMPVEPAIDSYLSSNVIATAGTQAPLITMGRLVPEKNIASAIMIAHLCARPLWIVGDGPERERLQALARALDANVTFQGWMGKERFDLLARSFGMLHVSKAAANGQREGAPLAIGEALSLGKPVFSLEKSGAESYLPHPGIRIEKSPLALATKIRNHRPSKLPAPRSTDSVAIFQSLGLPF